MATPTPPISQRTRSGTAKNLVQDKNDGDHEVFSKKKEPDNIVTPLQTNINEPLEPKEASSRRELRKKKQQVSFNTNKQVLQNTSSPVFLVSSPEKVSTNTVGQSTDQNLDVNNDASNKQTSSSAIGQTSVDHNNITSNDQIVNDQQVILPDIEMIMDEQEDDTNQFHKLENSKIIAILKVPINNPDNIDEYKKIYEDRTK
ncbi:12677_t:CDS:1 [Rhizophagus irregularis]|nr:12677_t:CDS:1 [Rhizophagus irregularis]